MNALISIVIPCYNHGRFLHDTLASIPSQNNYPIEIVIIDDGSTEPYTVDILNKLPTDRYKIIRQSNQGLGKSRNIGIQVATGKYILPLDADNKLTDAYLRKGVPLLEENSDIAVVYGDLCYFGDRKGFASVEEFNLQRLITGNYIDACALFRKSAWEAVGGYDGDMPFMGVEDWEFWLRLSFNGFKFYHLKDVCFYYRVVNTSMIHKDTSPNFNILKDYIEAKHSYYINYNAPAEYIATKFRANPFVFVFKLALLSYFPQKYKELVSRRKIKRI